MVYRCFSYPCRKPPTNDEHHILIILYGLHCLEFIVTNILTKRRKFVLKIILNSKKINCCIILLYKMTGNRRFDFINSSSSSTKGECINANVWTQQFIILSSMYAQLVVVICVAFFISEIVTPQVPLLYFEGFYLYLYTMSLLFLLYIYIYLLRDSTAGSGLSAVAKKITILESLRRLGEKGVDNGPDGPVPPRLKKYRISDNDKSHGSLFLRIGAIAFGLGTMVYNGLEFGSFFEVPPSSLCYNVFLGLNPILQMIFTFAQMYFIFVNARLNIQKFKVVARFGLMHIIATNLCVWIRTVGKEALEAIAENQRESGLGSSLEELILPFRVTEEHNNTTLNLSNPCQKQNIMGSIVSDASPFLYPFIVEYSLIAAAVLYVMWKNIGHNPMFRIEQSAEDALSRTSSSQSFHRVNCAGSSRGLFLGLFLLVIATICLIVFFVFIHHENLNLLAVYLSDLSHSIIMLISIFAIIVGFFRVRALRFHYDRKDHLRDLLLRVSAFGLYTYAMFGIIAGTLSPLHYTPNLLVMITSCLTIIQVTLQSLFVADITCRSTYLPEHDNTKPGRQVITFLLMVNLTFWIIYTFEMQKVQASPVQLGFYGFMAWTVIVRTTLPLSIFFRFHSFITFAEVWKNSYKNICN
nr:proton channel OtopLc isoform X1 [Parasteatoda tepidariorum]